MRAPARVLSPPRQAARLLASRAWRVIRHAAWVAAACARAVTAGPRGSALSLALALALGALVLRTIAGSQEGIARRPAVPAGATAPHRSATSIAAQQPVPAPQRRVFQDMEAAARWLGTPVWTPRALPAGVSLLDLAWEPDAFAANTPGGQTGGTLRAHYADARQEVMFVLEQGPGIGVSALGAPAERFGARGLSSGDVIWVRGHAVGAVEPGYCSVLDPIGCGCCWDGSEVRVGVAPIGPSGWRLSSEVLALDELLQVAEGLQRTEAATPATVFIVGLEEEAASLWAMLAAVAAATAGAGSQSPHDTVIVVRSPEDEARAYGMVDELNQIRGHNGVPDLRVIDLRQR